MLAENPVSVQSYSELDGYCEFGFPATSFELGSLAATLPRVSSSKLDLRNGKLDEVVRAFGKVYDGRDISVCSLIKAIRAHLELMRSGGAALSVVAKDLENNLCKVEQLYRRHPNKCKTLASLLEFERDEMVIHRGNELKEDSAAMGLLWIRRSISFQQSLYDSLVPANGKHPKQAAQEAYQETLAPYHGWMLRTLFQASLQMPARATFIAAFGEVDESEVDGPTDTKVANKLRALVSTLEPLLQQWTDCFVAMDLEDMRKV